MESERAFLGVRRESEAYGELGERVDHSGLLLLGTAEIHPAASLAYLGDEGEESLESGLHYVEIRQIVGERGDEKGGCDAGRVAEHGKERFEKVLWNELKREVCCTDSTDGEAGQMNK